MSNMELVDALLETKTWSDLSEKERDLVLEVLGSEEVFNHMRRLTKGPSPAEDNSGADRIYQNLEAAFDRKHPRVIPWYATPIPAHAAAVALLVMSFATFWLTRGNTASPVAEIRTVTIHDTVTQRLTDTVYVNKVVYRDRYIKRDSLPLQFVRTQPNAVNDKTNSRGVSMKEKEELDRLLVSGVE